MNFKEIRNTVVTAISSTIEGGQHTLKVCYDNPRKFKDNLVELGTPSWVTSGAYVVLPIMFPALATPKYFSQVKASIIIGTAFAATAAAFVTAVEEEAKIETKA